MPCSLRRNPGAHLESQTTRVAALGNFEGLHRGHQRILQEVVRLAQGGPTELISFYPHPREVLGVGSRLEPLLSLRSELDLLTCFGIQQLTLIHFTREFSLISASDFVREFLIRRCGVRQLVIGPDARIGHNRQGDAEFIKHIGLSLGLSVHIVEWEEQDGQRISSSLIRRFLNEGAVELVERQLGRPYSIYARVIHGQARGRTIGFPTANLHTPKQLLPMNGVYAGSVMIKEVSYPALCNIGIRPTFSGGFSGDNELRAEVHIIDYKGPELYGQKIEFRFLSRVRDEIKFSSLEELTAQISKDVERGRVIYGER